MACCLFSFASIDSNVPQLALQAQEGTMSNTNAVDCCQFAYRRNGDGSIDSICCICYLTAATADNQVELHEREKDHRCARRSVEERGPTGQPETDLQEETL
jgi:hypothetical protein